MAPRIELSGTMAPPTEPPTPNPSNPPRGILVFNPDTVDSVLHVKELMDSGYTAFDVICIGAGGGQGGYVDPFLPVDVNGASTHQPAMYDVKAVGGAGGGGGIQRLQGNLADLPDEVAVIAGAGGAAGTNHASDHTQTTDGGDGGASTFNGSTCQASGGKGGQGAQGDKTTLQIQGSSGSTPSGIVAALGGDGGIGGSSVAGGGGHAGIPQPHTPFSDDPTKWFNSGVTTPATPGAWDPVTGIGSGGGGGSGGAGYWIAPRWTHIALASDGAGGAFNSNDNSVYSPGETAVADGWGGEGQSQTLPAVIIPGFAGGAGAGPITGLATTYGDSQSGNYFVPIAAGNPPNIVVDSLKGKDGVVIVAVSAK